MTRVVRGFVVLPADAPIGRAPWVLIEARDVSEMDVPSVVVGELRLPDQLLEPGARIPFELEVPDVDPSRTLALRAHVSRDGSGIVSRGDLLSVAHIPVPSTGDVDGVELPLRSI
jgi:hypothetical protein